SNPNRFAVDIQNAWLASDAPRTIPVKGSAFVKQVRISQFDATTVRIVVDAHVFSDQINLFMLKNDPAAKKPHRLVLDFGNVNKPPKQVEKELAIVQKEIEDAQKAEQKADKPTKPAPAKPPVSAEPIETIDGITIDFEIVDDLDTSAQTHPTESTDSDEPTEAPEPKDAPLIIADPVDPKLDTSVLKGRTIVVDAGHGGSDSGAVGQSGLMEKTVTLKVAQLLEKQLKDAGATVLMTRKKDTDVARANATDAEELQARVDVGNLNEADVFLSIHIDSFINAEAHGTSVYIYDDTRLGKCLYDKLLHRLNRTPRGVKFANFYVLRHTTMSASLVELMFISNAEEEQLLKEERTHIAAANALFEGLCEYFAEKK
ncbi:MAG: N-acetylmuramoyl-L-alanine amidase, partial [Selenomonadales bacterium]|nr:N-acetylmuramoyl-L-alanine amidase [Selenomonadales bacterium]